MNPSREYLQACSIQTGYQMTPLEKVVRLGEMAGDITRHPLLGKVSCPQGREGAKEKPALLPGYGS